MKTLGSTIHSIVGRVVAALLMASALPLLTAPAAHADWSSWLYPSYSYSYAGQSMKVTGQARQHNYGCGLKDCDTVDYLKASTYRTSGSYSSNLARVSASTGFSGVGVSASVSTGAVGLGFSDYGSGCSHGWWTGGAYSASVSFGGTNICHASTWGWISDVKVTTTGGFRFGTHWEARSASRSVKVGGF